MHTNMKLAGLILLVSALACICWQAHEASAIATINIWKHRYPFYGGYGGGFYPYWGGYGGGGYGGIGIGGFGGYGRR